MGFKLSRYELITTLQLLLILYNPSDRSSVYG
jgi:hypothetical protein